MYPSFRIDTEFDRSCRKQLIDFLKTPRKFKIPNPHTHAGEQLRVSIRPATKKFIKKFIRHEFLSNYVDWIIKVEGTFKFPGAKKYEMSSSDGRKFSVHEKRFYWKETLPSELTVAILTYFCGLMIAFPGAVRILESVWLLGGKLQSHKDRFVSSYQEGVGFLSENGFEARASEFPEQIIQWVWSQNGMFDGYSDTPYSRSLNYFTRLLNGSFRNDELSDLVWAVAGIEALLVEGGRSSLGQIKEKLGAIFSNQPEVQKLVRLTEDMYNYRSRMVHGNRQIKSHFREDEMPEDKKLAEEYDSTRFAIGTLLVLLQRFAELKINKPSFRVVLHSK
jgi:hypothetical protein